MKITEATIQMPQEELLSSIWYPDGSGARFGGLQFSNSHDEWRITRIRTLDDQLGDIEIDIMRLQPTTVQGGGRGN